MQQDSGWKTEGLEIRGKAWWGKQMLVNHHKIEVY